MRLLSLFAESPIHAGTGTELGHVDLPIQRERATRFPTIHGSGIKGVLRDLARRTEKLDGSVVQQLFGSEPPSGPGGSPLEPGALIFSDARLVLFPCRTAGPVFAWVTSPYLLNRLLRDAVGASLPNVPKIVPKPSQSEAIVTQQAEFPEGGVLIEEFEFSRKRDDEAGKWADFLKGLLPNEREYTFWRDLLPKALVIVSDDNLRDFVTHATEVVTRVRLDPEKKTVAEKALWSEEYLPQDSLLYCVVEVTVRKNSERTALLSHFRTILSAYPTAQFGGKETVGRGFLRLKVIENGGHT